MRRVDLSKNGGFPLTQNALDFLQTAFGEPLYALGKMFGNKTIITGMEVGSSSVAEGWFFYNGEPIYFNASALDTKVAISEDLTSVEFEDGITKAVFKVKTAICSATGDFNFSDLQRLSSFTAAKQTQLDRTWLAGDVKQVFCDASYIAVNFDSSGLGRLERSGWAVCNGGNGTENMGGRVLVGMQYPALTVNPNDNVWDAIYNTALAVGGEKEHTLTVDEVPALDVVIPKVGYAGIGGSGSKFVGNANDPDAGTQTISTTGGGEAHENRQPFKVALFIQKL